MHNWTLDYDRRIQQVESCNGSLSPEATLRLVAGVKEELRQVMREFRGFDCETYRDFFRRLNAVRRSLSLS